MEVVASIPVLDPVPAPTRDVEDDRLEPAAELRQFVHSGPGRRWQRTPLDQPLVLEMSEPIGEQIGPDPGKPIEKVLEPPRPKQQLTNDQERPSTADDIEGLGHAAILA